MSIEQVSFKGIDTILRSYGIKRKESTSTNPNGVDEEKSNATKYMIGATAVAATIALGIIGHKNNWWRKGAETAEDLSEKVASAVDTTEVKIADTVTKTGEDAGTVIPDTKVHITDDKGEVADTVTKAGEDAEDLIPDINLHVTDSEGKVVDNVTHVTNDAEGRLAHSTPEVDYFDFSKIKGEVKKLSDGTEAIDEFDDKGRLVRTFNSFDGKKISTIDEFNPETGGIIKSTEYQSDGKRIWYTDEFDPENGKRIKFTKYQSDGKRIWHTDEFNPETEGKIKSTWYQGDGKTIWYIDEYNPETGKIIKTTWYQEDGKTVAKIDNFTTETKKE